MSSTMICIRCLRKSDKKDQYCAACGAPLHNTCTNLGGLTGDPCKKVNDREALFCIKCGAPTVFQQYGLLPRSPYPQLQLAEEDMEEFKLLQHPYFSDL